MLFNHRRLCLLQGVWNDTDGFTLTDPAVHSDEKGQFGVTDKGRDGMDKFFETHVCSGLCRALRLALPPAKGWPSTPAAAKERGEDRHAHVPNKPFKRNGNHNDK